MINLITQTIKQLGKAAKGANSSDLTKINRIKNAVENQDPDDILLILQKSGGLSSFFDYWADRSQENPEKIKETFKNTDRPVIQILIDQHILKSIVDPGKTKIVWTNPNIVNPQPNRQRSIAPESVSNKNPSWKAQSEIADIIGVSRQLIQKHAKKKLLPSVCTEGENKGKINRWHQCVEDYKSEVEAKRGTKADPLSKAIAEPGNKKQTVTINGEHQSEISIAEIENLTLKQIVERYGGIAGFKTYAETIEKLASWKSKELKYEQLRKKLVAKNPVANSLFSLIDAGNRRILEYPATVTDQLMAIAKGKKKTARIDMIELQTQTLSRILKSVKREVLKGLDDVERD